MRAIATERTVENGCPMSPTRCYLAVRAIWWTYRFLPNVEVEFAVMVAWNQATDFSDITRNTAQPSAFVSTSVYGARQGNFTHSKNCFA